MLNYRKKEAWDVLIQELVEFADEFGIDGVHLDNGQAWPQIMEIDAEEMFRMDDDGQPAYSPLEIFEGEIVVRNENHGYWNTNTMEHYPNPFFVKLCAALWRSNPDFMIVGECWGGYMFENRQTILTRSGIIPRLFKLPQTLISVLGKKLHKDGRVTASEDKDVSALKDWFESTHRFLPDGAILLQSSTAHSFPYPAYLYGRATWAAVDIIFLLSDIPITFMDEMNGQVYRVSTTSIFQHQPLPTTTLKRSNSRLLQSMTMDEEETKAKPKPVQSPEEKRKLNVSRSGSNLADLVYSGGRDGKTVAQKDEEFKKEVGPEFGFDLS